MRNRGIERRRARFVSSQPKVINVGIERLRD